MDHPVSIASDLTQLTDATLGADNRRALRQGVKLPAKLRDRTGARFNIEVVDLSVTGFRAEVVHTLHPGTAVWITIPGLAGLEAEVAWQRQEHVGCSFLQPLHAAVFDHVVKLAGK